MLLGQQPRIHLAFGLHNHQPHGNLDWVVSGACDRAYAPFLSVLERHPGVRATLHYSGYLLEWLAVHRADLVEKIKKLAGGGQVELLGGAHYEPILAIIPDDSKLEQIVFHRRVLGNLFGAAPEGMWLAERVWEPHLVRPIAEAGMAWTCLDDSLFRAAGLRGPELHGYYQSEEQGHYLQIFPLNQDFCRLLPFSPPQKAIEFLRQAATPDGSRLVVAFDSGEKFGVWPGTGRTVYEAGWLDEFFTLLEENADWIVCTTPTEYRAQNRPWGRIYLPAGTYREMQGWALPADQQAAFESAQGGDFVQGGFWRHFLVKYPEANNLHKKMLAVSAQVAAAMRTRRVLVPAGDVQEPGAFRDDWVTALHHLWRGQSNDPYWHGVFGGLYLPHLRGAAYSALIMAERICDGLSNDGKDFLDAVADDFDGDGIEEILVRSGLQNAYFTRKGGALFELDYKPAARNLLDTLARRPEAYHAKLPRAIPAQAAESGGIARSIHELILTKEEGLEKHLHYDWYRRVSLLDHFLHPDSHLGSFCDVTYGEQGDFVIEAYEAAVASEDGEVIVTLRRDGHVWVGQEFWPIALTKRIRIPRDRALVHADYEVRNGGDRPVSLWFGVEFNNSLPAAPGDGRSETRDLTELASVDADRGISLVLRWERPATVWRMNVETISQSEAGFERVYQGTAIMPHWRLELPAGGTWATWIAQEIVAT